MLTVDSGNAAVLVLLDLSAAFDTIDHKILNARLERLVGFQGTVLKWFENERMSFIARYVYTYLLPYLLPSGKRFRSMMAKTERLWRSFFPQTIRLLNSNSVS